jgi:hypothetical protein
MDEGMVGASIQSCQCLQGLNFGPPLCTIHRFVCGSWTVLLSLFLILFRNYDQYGEVQSTCEDVEVSFVKQYLYLANFYESDFIKRLMKDRTKRNPNSRVLEPKKQKETHTRRAALCLAAAAATVAISPPRLPPRPKICKRDANVESRCLNPKP